MLDWLFHTEQVILKIRSIQMDNRKSELQQQKNSELSLALIVVNVVLATVLYSSIASSDDAKILIIPVMIWVATVLIGIYMFTYSGKAQKLSKWVFGVLLVISLVLIGLTMYIIALGGAFKN